MSRPPDMLRRLALILVAVLLGMVIFEGYARLADYVGYGNQQVVGSDVRNEAALAILQKGANTPPAGETRILVLGDSMAYSPGVPHEDLWSTLLEQRIRAEVGDAATVLNAARAGGNTWTQLQQARELLPAVKPSILLLMYNYNDIHHQLRPGHAGGTETTDNAASSRRASRQGESLQAEAPGRESRTMTRRHPLARVLEWARVNSIALNGCLPRINMQLKAWGFVIPGTDFHHLSRIAYATDGDGWPEIQEMLLELRHLCTAQGATLVVYVLPHFDTLRRDLFVGPRRIVSAYLDEIGVLSGFGFEHFKGRTWQELAVSPFDGHPNARANREIAEVVYTWLRENDCLVQRAQTVDEGETHGSVDP